MKAILTWHSIDTTSSPISVTPDAFERQVDWLAEGHVPVVHLSEIETVDDGSDAIALTFDDGFESFGSFAAPRLLDAGLPVTVFVVTGRVGLDNSWGGRPEAGIPTLDLLDWDRLGELQEAGVTLGAHTRDHPVLPDLSSGEIEEQMDACIEALEARTGVKPTTFAYPYGRYDDRAVTAAATRFELSVTADHDLLDPDAGSHELQRLDMYYYGRPDRLAAWGTPAFRRYLFARRAGRAVRHTLARWGSR